MNAVPKALLAGSTMLLLAACSSGLSAAEQARIDASANAYADKVVSDMAASENAWAPPGFTVVQPGLAFRWSDDVTCPEYADSCYGVELVTRDGCPSGVYIELAQLDGAGNVVGKANEITAGLAPGDRAKVAVTGVYKAPKAKLAQINCM